MEKNSVRGKFCFLVQPRIPCEICKIFVLTMKFIMKVLTSRQLRYLGLILLLVIIIIVLLKHGPSTNYEISQELSKCHVQKDEIVRDVQTDLPHLPIRFWEENEWWNWWYKNWTCARFPGMSDLQIYDKYWQSLHTRNYKFHLFGAYYDTRKRFAAHPAVRILGMIDSNSEPSDRVYCQMWFPNRKKPVIVQSSSYVNIMKCYWEWELPCENILYSYLITCPIPREFRKVKPTYISLVENVCDIATNILTINYNVLNKNEQKDQIAVCVKMLDFLHDDFSVRAVEWIELLRLLGADKIFFYTLHVNEHMTKVFEFYKEKGIVEVVPITLGGYQPNTVGFQHLFMYHSGRKNYFQRTLHELISLNDCFYKNMYKYKYISSLDLDEVIIPRKELNWKDFLNRLFKESNSSDKDPVACYRMGPTIFTPICDSSTEWNKDIPSYMYMLQHVLHHEFQPKENDTKAFLDTEVVEAVFNHYSSKCLNEQCKEFKVNPNDAQVFHYRESEIDPSITCDQVLPEMRNDTSLWRYKDLLTERTSAALTELGLLL